MVIVSHKFDFIFNMINKTYLMQRIKITFDQIIRNEGQEFNLEKKLYRQVLNTLVNDNFLATYITFFKVICFLKTETLHCPYCREKTLSLRWLICKSNLRQFFILHLKFR